MWQIIARDILRNFVFCFFSFNFCLRFVIFSFLYARLETGHIMWLGMAGGHPHRFPHKNFSSIYWIFTKLGHMIPLWKGKNPIYFGVTTIIPLDNLYRLAYFAMHTFLVAIWNNVYVIQDISQIWNNFYIIQDISQICMKWHI